MWDIPNKVSDGVIQMTEATELFFVDWSFHCSPQIRIRGRRSGEHGDQMSNEISRPPNTSRRSAMEPRTVCAVAPHCWKQPRAMSFSCKWQLKGHIISSQQRSELIASWKNMWPIIRLRDIAHHTRTFWSCSGVSIISCGLNADHTRLFNSGCLRSWRTWINGTTLHR
jgi:hypothetical protein